MAELGIDKEDDNSIIYKEEPPLEAPTATNSVINSLGGSYNIKQITALAEQMLPKDKPFDPALASLLYFTKMGELASKPGATLFGSVAGAGVAPAQYLLQKEKEKAEREKDIAKTTLTLAATLGKTKASKAYTDTSGKVRYFTPREFGNLSDIEKGGLVPYKAPTTGIKTVGSGTLAKYYTPEGAKEFVKSQGISEGDDNFLSLVKQFTTPSADMLGQPITEGGVYLEAVPLVKGEKVFNIQLSPSKSSVKPYFTTYVEKRLPLIAKSADTYNTTAREVLPRVQEAMNLLKSEGVVTGAVEAKFLETRRLFNNAFGLSDPQIIGLETLQSTSNFIAPKMRPVGSGSTSDMEFRAYQRASLDIGNTPKANYISLYSFKKMSENAVKLNQKEQELLTSGNYRNMVGINKELNKFDKGIFEKYTGDLDNDDEIKSWMDSLPDGAVIINNGIFNTQDPYIIKGWGK